MEAGWRNGSLNIAGHACALARGLAAVPGPITSAAAAGTHRLLREHGASCITGADDERELLGIASSTRGGRDDGRPPTDDTTRVRDALSPKPARSAADVADRAGMSPAETEAILGLLHLKGAAVRTPGGWRAASGAE